MADAQQLADMLDQLTKLQADYDSLKAEKQDAGSRAPSRQAPIYVSTRKIDRFKDRPQTASDPTAEDWVADMRSHLAARGLPKADQAMFICEHLTGRARREIEGRGTTVKGDPEAILTTILKVFGDGNTLPQLQQKFYGYKQGESEDLVACSLSLVALFDRMERLDSTCSQSRQTILKGRLAEAVQDESLRRELRRLNIEAPDLDFFDFRDRAQKWLGNDSSKQVKGKVGASVQEAAVPNALEMEVKRQGDLLAAQQKSLETLIGHLSQASNDRQAGQQRGPRQCWRCGSADHFKRNCPQPAADPAHTQKDPN